MIAKDNEMQFPWCVFQNVTKTGQMVKVMCMLTALTWSSSHTASQKHISLLPVNHTYTPSSEVKTPVPLNFHKIIVCPSGTWKQTCLRAECVYLTETDSSHLLLVNSILEWGPDWLLPCLAEVTCPSLGFLKCTDWDGGCRTLQGMHSHPSTRMSLATAH